MENIGIVMDMTMFKTLFTLIITHFRSCDTFFLKACSHAYILITLIPAMISFMTRIRSSVISADLSLYA